MKRERAPRLTGPWEFFMTNRILRAAAATVTTLILLSPATAAEMKAKKEPTAAQMAARERMSKCSAEWKEAKMSGKVEPGMKWPKFWSACNARMEDSKA
jgi:hypothetical protein